MAFYRGMIRYANDTGLDADASVSTFHFATNETGTIEEEATDIGDALGTWATSVDGIMSANVGTSALITVYNLEDPTPRVPVFEDTATITPGAGFINNQVALVVRYRANYTSGVARARRRGRVFVGPLAAIGDDSTGDMSPSATQIAAAGVAVDTLLPAVAAGISGSIIEWQVFSRAIFDETSGSLATKYAAAMSSVVEASVPNRFGTQRRRVVQVTSVSDITP